MLRGLVGTTVTTYDLVSDGASPETTFRTWVITEKLVERAAPLTEHDVRMGRGSPKTVGKFLCHLADDPKQIAFMRIYQQIPITGTEDADNDTLARQAVPPGVCGELEAFKLLQRGGCSAVPRFLGHAEGIQGEHDLLPGGYVRYLVWEKVPGEPLTEEFFWGLDDTARNDIRCKFRAAYNRISGFRRGWPVIELPEWSEARYVEYGLAKPSKETDWYLHPEKWEW
ncbi:hypothetical protein Aspvir_002991 [Aspergillus viridinutans]|uniref:Uncharacterized protein n=1 Tax=Aspergillus viridinutans TaxID=75553 RepID=A0A9P3CBT4_ASPVI|nr:uncharacterized protein Aspvir_002991 [Aspergillus viridinutans]GIK07329.1 hypothetical protein Aspvir_002991 [Aspergillus viridinutans]